MVKHKLTQEDITDLGWLKVPDKLLYTFNKNYELQWYKREDGNYVIQINYRLFRAFGLPTFNTIFSGIIKTKRELKTLMKQLEII